MIQLTFNSTDRRLVAVLQSRGPQVREEVTRTLDVLMLELQRLVQTKLEGTVLTHRSGKLAGSISKEPTVSTASGIMGRVTGAAGAAFYGKIQEKGGTSAYEILPVRAKALAFFPTGSLGAGGGIAQIQKSIINNLYTKSGVNRGRLKTSSYEKFSSFGGVVVAKVIHPPLPPRPFMRPSLDEMRDAIVSRLQAAVVRGVTGK